MLLLLALVLHTFLGYWEDRECVVDERTHFFFLDYVCLKGVVVLVIGARRPQTAAVPFVALPDFKVQVEQ
jgi:hypothetical protein